MTPDEQNTKQRHAALRAYLIAFNEMLGEHTLEDDEIMDYFFTVLYQDMGIVSCQLAWEEPPQPGERGC